MKKRAPANRSHPSIFSFVFSDESTFLFWDEMLFHSSVKRTQEREASFGKLQTQTRSEFSIDSIFVDFHSLFSIQPKQTKKLLLTLSLLYPKSSFTGAETAQYITPGDSLLRYHNRIGNSAISFHHELTVGSTVICSLLHSCNWKCCDDSWGWGCSTSTLRSDNGNVRLSKLLNSFHISIR